MNLDWPLVALLQMALISLSIGTGLGLAVRGLRRQNRQLRTHLDNAEPPPEPASFWQQALDALPQEGPFVALERLVFEHRLQPVEDYNDALAALITANPESGQDADSEQRLAELEQQIAQRDEQIAELQDSLASEDSEQTRSLLQQFTRDSRDLVSCIETLQAENADLRAQLDQPSSRGADSVDLPDPEDGVSATRPPEAAPEAAADAAASTDNGADDAPACDDTEGDDTEGGDTEGDDTQPPILDDAVDSQPQRTETPSSAESVTADPTASDPTDPGTLPGDVDTSVIDELFGQTASPTESPQPPAP